MKNKNNLTLAEMVEIFCKERESMREYVKGKFNAHNLDDSEIGQMDSGC